MRRIVALCRRNGIPLYIEQMPMSRPSHEIMSQNGYYDAYRAYLSQFDGNGVTVEYNVPCYDIEYFRDAHHVNPAGREKFTAEIKEKYGL